MKARSLITPVALIALAAGTGAYAYLDRARVSDADRATRRSDVFGSFRVEEVSRVALTHGDERLVLERSADAGAGAGWSMVSPRQERADPAAVDALLRELELATRLRAVQPGDAVGLDAPRAVGEVKVGPLQYRFALGGDAARPEGAAYLRLDGEGTFVVGRSLKVQLLRGADAYRERALVPYGASGMARIEAHAASGAAFVLQRQGASFRVGGAELRASRQAVDQLMAAVADARADVFLDDAEAERATQAPVFTVKVTPREGEREPVELRVGGPCASPPGDVVVARRGASRISACTAHTLVEALASAAAGSLVDAAPFFAHADEMEELTLEPVGRTGPRVELARRGATWRERAPEERDLTSDEADSANLLSLALAQARGTDVRRPTADERFEPRDRVTVVRTGDQTREVVELATPGADGNAVLRREDDGAILHLARAQARRFEPHPAALRARTSWRTPVETGAVVALDDTCTPSPERAELRDRAWVLRGPASVPADGAAISDLLGAIARTKTEGWIAEADDGGFGFEGPGACSVSLSLEGAGDAGPRRLTMVFGASGDGGTYARTQDDPGVFVASTTLRQALAHPSVDRSRLRVDLLAGARITVVRGAARRILSDEGGDDERLAAALGGLFAQSALHLGPALPGEGFERPTLEILSTSRSDAGQPEARVVLGAETEVDGAGGYFARAAGIDATFFVLAARGKAILDAL